MPETITDQPTTVDALRSRLSRLSCADEAKLTRRINAATSADPQRRNAALADLERDIERSAARLERRRAAVPQLVYPPELPITERRDDLLAVIAQHQVVVVAGETGSGKSTQLPKLCIEAGRGVRGLIGHTQPRRIAARSVAERVAEEMGTDVGALVGYSVRFTDRVGEDTMVKLMTDGILLAEIQRDRLLTRYDTVIIDEAHERSLNIDFLLGYLRQVLPRRPDLKVIITSATIDTDRFSRHFADAPIIEVSGRAHPVEVQYQPLDDPDNEGESLDQVEGICAAVRALQRMGPGDVLVFCSGEREIRDAAHALRALRLADTEVLPLYARLSSAEQHRVFEPHTARRIVLATNVAETSLTVPGVRYVVDPGTARISRYSHRTKVQRLPIEPVSQASANQRTGRCGRIGPGICIRLYSEEDFESRPEFTEPEIQRTSLASVILQMASLGLGKVEDFPFVDPPDHRSILDGIALLNELGAIDPAFEGTSRWLTPVGRQLAALPLDPRLGRMVIEADRNDCLHEVMVIAAGLTIQDPRERPPGPAQAQAAALHARFAGEGSDLLSLLRLWDHLHEARRDRSSNQFRRLCRAEHLHVLRVREWQDLYAQLRRIVDSIGLRRSHQQAGPDQIHRAILAGLLSHIGMKEGDSREYRGARNSRFAVAAGSSLGGRSPSWVMAAELVETNRVWARGVAAIRPEWAEELGEHLVKRTYSDAWWDRRRGAALASERVTLFGLALVTDRTIEVEHIDPRLARELFIDHALIDGEWDSTHGFIDRNAERVREVEDLAARIRRDLLAPPGAVMEFFEARIPDDVTSSRDFNRWWRRRRKRDPAFLDIPIETLIDPSAGPIDPRSYPDEWQAGSTTLPLTYTFDPASRIDGVSVEVPISLLGQLDPDEFSWTIPGYRPDLVDALIRSLPKPVRRNLVPVPDTVRQVLGHMEPSQGGLLDSLRQGIAVVAGVRLAPDAFDLDRVPAHLRPTFRIFDDQRTVAIGKDLVALRTSLDDQVRSALSDLDLGVERTGLTDWPGGSIPRHLDTAIAGHEIRVYPALVDDGDTVSVRFRPDAADQADAMWAGTRRLVRLRLPAAGRAMGRLPTNELRLALVTSPYPDEQAWLDDLLGCVLDHLIDAAGGPAWTQEGFEALIEVVRCDLTDTLRDVWSRATSIIRRHHAIGVALERLQGPGFESATKDARAQLARLVYDGMLTAIGIDRVTHVERYLTAIERRVAKLPDEPARDRDRMLLCRRIEHDYDLLRTEVAWSPELEEIGWMLEELRVATFAQPLGTAQPVSEKRIRSAMARVRGR